MINDTLAFECVTVIFPIPALAQNGLGLIHPDALSLYIHLRKEALPVIWRCL